MISRTLSGNEWHQKQIMNKRRKCSFLSELMPYKLIFAHVQYVASVCLCVRAVSQKISMEEVSVTIAGSLAWMFMFKATCRCMCLQVPVCVQKRDNNSQERKCREKWNEMENDYSEIKKNKALTLIMCVINTLHCKMGSCQCRNGKETALL